MNPVMLLVIGVYLCGFAATAWLYSYINKVSSDDAPSDIHDHLVCAAYCSGSWVSFLITIINLVIAGLKSK